jgi:ribosomal protein S18 acetylase RimI-like enzyme
MADTEERAGADFSVRLLTDEDGPEFVDFVSRVPEGERRFLQEDLTDPETAFTTYFPRERARRLIAVDERVGGRGDIVGIAGAFPEGGWSSHVAELRVLVSAAHRRLGIGRMLAHAAVVEALRLGCTHVFVEVIAEQDALVAMFQDLGFEPQALLPDFVRDGSGGFHDLMVLTLHADAQWNVSQILGLEDVAS